MAREEHNREDLMRDARALERRAEIELPEDLRLVLGKHRRGGLSFYFGEDPVFHLNSQGELRRAYAEGRLYKAEGGRLIEMERVRIPGQVELRSHALAPHGQNEFTAAVHRRLTEAVECIDRGTYALVAEVPEGESVVDELVAWLRPHLAQPLKVASAPNVI